MVTFYAGTDLEGQYEKLAGPGCADGGSYQWFGTNPPQFEGGAHSWQASDDCWATTLYYGDNYDGAKYQYPQGTYKADQIGAPWGGHVGSVWTGYKR